MHVFTMVNENTKEIVYIYMIYMCRRQEGWLKFVCYTKRCQTYMPVSTF